MPLLWNRDPSESNYLSPMLRAISLNMAVKNSSTNPINPSNFLWSLKRNLSSKRVAPFDFNSQQDVAEILHVVLDEVKGVSLAASRFKYTKNNNVLQHLPILLCFRGKPWYTAPTNINCHKNVSQPVSKAWDFIISEWMVLLFM